MIKQSLFLWGHAGPVGREKWEGGREGILLFTGPDTGSQPTGTTPHLPIFCVWAGLAIDFGQSEAAEVTL